jgi:UDP-N-acetylglucosamine--N-acetylmuramyl-(pentapeptide) pyrophosphoryl-undecaprenol N-acetylglucosamine transferase
METGQPVRSIFYQQTSTLPEINKQRLDPKKGVITVIGGSQGARRVNSLIFQLWERLGSWAQVIHITGPQEYETYREAWKKLSKEQQQGIHVTPFLKDELPALFQLSDVVVSRAGGIIAELAASRACTILIPLSSAAQNHQWANARVLEQAGAAVTFDELSGTAKELEALILRIKQDSQECTQLRAAIGRFDHPDAAARMAQVLLDPLAFP